MKPLVGLLLFCVALAQAEPLKVRQATGSIIRTKGQIQTGSSSKIELELPYLAIVRIGSNADFQFSSDARDLTLDSGTMMFSAPKGSGDVLIVSGPVVTAVNGGGSLQAANVGGRAKVIALDGRLVTGLIREPKKALVLRAGEMVDVKAGATKMPGIAAVNLSTMIKSSVLFNMGPFPGKAAIEKNAAKQMPRATFRLGALSPESGDPTLGVAAGAMQTQAIIAQETAIQQQQIAAQQLAAQQAAEQAAAQQRIASVRQLAIQQQQQQQAAAAAEQQRQQQANQGKGPQGNQGVGPGGNQGGGNQGQGNQGQGQGNQGQGQGGGRQ